jgi:hypothetical protein
MFLLPPVIIKHTGVCNVKNRKWGAVSLFFFVQPFQGGDQRAAQVLDAAEGERFQGVANNVFFQVKGVVVLAAIDERERFEFSKIWIRSFFLPGFSKNQDLVEDITGRC